MKMESILAAKGTQTFSVDPATTVRDGLALLASNNIGALIVLDGAGMPIGILSERDVIRGLAAGTNVMESTVGEMMTSPIVTGTPADDVESVLHTMTTRRFRHLPIVDKNGLVGMVTLGDLVKAQLNDSRGTIATLETQLLGGEQ